MDTSELDSKKYNGQNGEPGRSPTLFEDAIILTGHGKFHLLLLIVSGCCLIAMVCEVFGTAFLIPAAQCEFNMSSSDKGLLNAITYIGMISSSHLWGYLADTRGRKKMLIVALLLDGICSVISSFAHTLWLFLLLRYLNGFFICAPSAVVFAYLGEFHSTSTRTRAILLMSVFLSLGGLFQQGLAWAVIPQEWRFVLTWPSITYSSWRIFVLINALPSFIVVMILYLMPESPKFLLSVGKSEEALKILKLVYSMNTGKNSEEYPVHHVIMDATESESSSNHPTSCLQILNSMWQQTKPLFQRPNLLLTSLAFILQFSLYASFNGLILWLPDIYNKLAQYSELHPDHTFTICEVLTVLKENMNDLTVTATNNISYISQSWSNNSNEMTLDENSTNINFEALGINTLFNNTKSATGYISNNSVINSVISVNPNNIDGDDNCGVVDAAVFRNNLSIGCVCIVIYTVVGFSVAFVRKKPLIVVCLLISTAAGASLNFTYSEILIVALSAFFIATSGVCVNMVNSIVIDFIPTHLRAMAVCLALMSGRFGVAVSSLLIGALLDYDCYSIFFLLSGVTLVCCFLACFLPSPNKSTT